MAGRPEPHCRQRQTSWEAALRLLQRRRSSLHPGGPCTCAGEWGPLATRQGPVQGLAALEENPEGSQGSSPALPWLVLGGGEHIGAGGLECRALFWGGCALGWAQASWFSASKVALSAPNGPVPPMLSPWLQFCQGYTDTMASLQPWPWRWLGWQGLGGIWTPASFP